MNYTKPEISKLADAAVAICSEDSLVKLAPGADISNPHRETAMARSEERRVGKECRP